MSKIPGEVEELLGQARYKDWRQSLRAIHRLDPSIDSILSSIPSLSEEEFIPRFLILLHYDLLSAHLYPRPSFEDCEFSLLQ